jgi:hypothetical protein
MITKQMSIHLALQCGMLSLFSSDLEPCWHRQADHVLLVNFLIVQN